MVILCLIGVTAAAGSYMRSPALQYTRYNEQEIAAYSFTKTHLAEDKLVYSDMKSVNGLVLIGDHLNTTHGFDFARGRQHYVARNVEVFYSPSDIDFEQLDKYILVADYMYTLGIVPTNELYPPSELATRQALLNNSGVSLLYNNGDAQILAAGNGCSYEGRSRKNH